MTLLTMVQGKKTYLSCVLALGVIGFWMLGVIPAEVAEPLLAALGFGGLIALRAGVSRAPSSVNREPLSDGKRKTDNGKRETDHGFGMRENGHLVLASLLLPVLVLATGCAGSAYSPADVRDSTTVMTLVAIEATNLSPEQARKGLAMVDLVEQVLLRSADATGTPDWDGASEILGRSVSPAYQAGALAILGMIKRHVRPLLARDEPSQVRRYLLAAANGARLGLQMAAREEALPSHP